jgi:hypothetical protein
MASATISELPTELVGEIQCLLPYAPRLALRLTCRALYTKTDDSRLIPRYGISDLLQIETWPPYNDAAQRPQNEQQPIAGKDFFSCTHCLRIRSAIYFSNAMMTGKRGKAAAAEDKCKRICISCGIMQGKYRKNDVFRYGGAPVPGEMNGAGIVCQYCGEFHSVHFLHD